MKKIVIFMFSGTGMTYYVIGKIKNEFAKKKIQADVYLLEKTNAKVINVNNYDMLGIAYPVHSFNAPEIVIDFAKKLPEVTSINTETKTVIDTFIISTAGGESSSNFSSSRLLSKILRKKGYNVFYDKQFIMPCNFMVKDSEDTVKDKLNKVNTEIPKTADEIIKRTPQKLKENCFSKTIAFLGRLEWAGLRIMQKFFYITSVCNNCMVCVKHCPKSNIALANKNIVFKKQCMLCMKCVYLCPKQCIKTKRLFKFITFNEWYKKPSS